jgi:hypothetical protein
VCVTPLESAAAIPAGGVLVQGDSSEAVVEHTVDPAVVVDPRVLGRGVEHQRAEPFDRRDGVDALPEQVGRVHFRTHVGGTGLLDETFHGRRVEHQVLRVHLDGDLDTVFPCQGVDLGPERHRDVVPLVVQ